MIRLNFKYFLQGYKNMSQTRKIKNNTPKAEESVPKEISDTAKLVASMKASVQFGGWPGIRTAPLFKKQNPLISEEDKQKIAGKPLTVRISLAVRERFFNKQMHYYIKKEGFRQIVILGSGLDCRAYHKNKDNQHSINASIYEHVQFYEVDCSTILEPKKRFFTEKQLDKNAQYIHANYTKDNFIEMLKEKGLDVTVPTLIIWEGNTMYVERQKIEKLFQDLKEFPKMTIVFDHFTRDMIEGPRENSIYELHRQGLWVTGFNTEDVMKLAKTFQMNTVTTAFIDHLKEEYEVEDNPEPSHYLISTMRR